MSDPVTNTDIEDVLAQVRRLVLQGAPAEAARPVRTTLLQSPASSRPEGRGRLVLTPAQRVEDAAQPAQEQGTSLRTPRSIEPAAGRSPMAAPVPLLLSTPAARSERDGAALDPAAAAAVSGIGTEPRGPQPTGAIEPMPKVDPSREASPRSDGTSDLEADWTPGWTSDWTLAEDLEEEPQDAIEGAAPLVFRHRARPLGDEAVAAAPPSPAPSALPDEDRESVPGLDEARLRAIVLEVVRAELQGELGERITRNLRKLVRREVFRVLESREES